MKKDGTAATAQEIDGEFTVLEVPPSGEA
jgi:hypothetical protein